MRKLTVTIATASFLFACQALTNIAEGVPHAAATAVAMKKPAGFSVRRAEPAHTAAHARTLDAAQSSVDGASSAPRPTPAQQDPGPVCCCRFFAQGWQHGWRGQSACDSAGGTCVAPDHCR